MATSSSDCRLSARRRRRPRSSGARRRSRRRGPRPRCAATRSARWRAGAEPAPAQPSITMALVRGRAGQRDRDALGGEVADQGCPGRGHGDAGRAADQPGRSGGLGQEPDRGREHQRHGASKTGRAPAEHARKALRAVARRAASGASLADDPSGTACSGIRARERPRRTHGAIPRLTSRRQLRSRPHTECPGAARRPGCASGCRADAVHRAHRRQLLDALPASTDRAPTASGRSTIGRATSMLAVKDAAAGHRAVDDRAEIAEAVAAPILAAGAETATCPARRYPIAAKTSPASTAALRVPAVAERLVGVERGTPRKAAGRGEGLVGVAGAGLDGEHGAAVGAARCCRCRA